MTMVAPQIDALDADITAARAQLRYCRRRSDHSPSADAINDEQAAERYLDQLLDQRHGLTHGKEAT